MCLGGPLLAAKNGLGRPLLVATFGWDHFWHDTPLRFLAGCIARNETRGHLKWRHCDILGCNSYSGSYFNVASILFNESTS